MDDSNNEKESENKHTKPNTTERTTDTPDSPYGLDNIFDPDNLPMEDKHVTEPPPNPRTHVRSHYDITWEPIPPYSKHDPSSPTGSDIHVCTFDHDLFNTDDGIPLIYPKLIDWDQRGPSIFDHFKNDEAIAELFELHEGILKCDHKSGFSIDLNIMEYSSESTPYSRHKSENKRKNEKKEKNRPLGENCKVPLNHEKVKIKGISEGENLSKAPKDGRLDIPPPREKSTFLIEMTKEINLGVPNNPKIIHFVASLSQEEKHKFVKFFLEKQIKFAWSYADMPGLDPEPVLHHLPLKPGEKPVKQKLRKMHPQVTLLVKIELKKLLIVGLIRSIDYGEWISNLVPISKNSRGIHICTYFHDLNKACPKDDFLLPNIDIIVDMTTGYKMLSLMDGFLGYN